MTPKKNQKKKTKEKWLTMKLFKLGSTISEMIRLFWKLLEKKFFFFFRNNDFVFFFFFVLHKSSEI